MFSAYKNKKQLIGFITSFGDTPALIIVDSVSEKSLHHLPFKIENAESFIINLPTWGNNIFKAFIVDLFGQNFDGTTFQSSYKYCKELKELFSQLQISCFFISESYYLFSSLLIATKMESNIGKTVTLIVPSQTDLTIGEFKFTQNGYELIQQKIIDVDFKAKPQILRQQIFGTSKPDKVIFAKLECKKFAYNRVFKSMDLVVYECCLRCHRGKFAIETCKWMFDKSYIKYHILPTCHKSIHVYGYYGSEKNTLDILKIDVNDSLPISKTAVFTKSVPKIYVVHEDKALFLSLTKELSNDCYKYKITVTVDESNLDNVKITKQYIPDFNDFLEIFDSLRELKIPFIGFYDNSSVIAVHKDSEGYQFLKEWNGKYGNENFISFDQKKPKFGKTAMDLLETKNTFVIFDLLKIMSMPSDKIEVSKHWGFTITKDDENPVLLEFDNFDGTKKQASPSFLMAMILRQHLKLLQNKVGEKPKKIGLWILKELNDEEMERIKEGLEEACKMLKLEFIFVETI